MATRLYVGNLASGTSDSDLQSLFGTHGTVRSAHVIMDRMTGLSKGFGFVEMESGSQAQSAIKAINGQAVNGRALAVKEARPRADGVGSKNGSGRGGDRRS